jgi:hypothetical protein
MYESNVNCHDQIRRSIHAAAIRYDQGLQGESTESCTPLTAVKTTGGLRSGAGD